jgi:hypothetical protein
LEKGSFSSSNDGVFTWAFLSALKNYQARSWIPENPTWSASKSGKEQLFCSTSGTECQMIQTSVKKKNNIASFYLQQKMSNLDLLFDSGPRPRSRNLNPDCDFCSKFERISSQWNGATGRSLILGDTLAPTETDFRKK